MTTTSDSTPPLDKEAALNWLRNAGRVETTVTALAKAWGWERTRASRALKRWAADGRISRRSGLGGKTVTFAAVVPVNKVAQQSAATALISAERAVLPVQTSSATVHTVAQPVGRQARSPNVQSTLMFVVAIGLGLVGLVVNARFAASFGRSDEAAFILATIGALIDVLVVMLLSVGCRLWRSGSRAAGAAAWCLWLFVAGMSLLAGAGFGATNIGDAIANRDRVVHEVVGVRATVDRLRAERAMNTESRPTSLLQVQLERERAAVDRDVWKATRGCHDVTAPTSAAACAAVMATHEAIAAASRREAIEAELRVAEEKLATLPAMQAAADPQAEVAADIVDWISNGKLTPEPQHIARLRIIGFALMPTLGGVVMVLGMALRREAVVS
jgi:hypothetical protein